MLVTGILLLVALQTEGYTHLVATIGTCMGLLAVLGQTVIEWINDSK